MSDFKILMDVVLNHVRPLEHQKAALGKAIKSKWVPGDVRAHEVEAFVDWHKRSLWRVQNAPLTVATFLSEESSFGFLPWLSAYRANGIDSKEKFAKLSGPYIPRPDLRNFTALDSEYENQTWPCKGYLLWHQELWVYLWYTAAQRELPTALEVVHQGERCTYLEELAGFTAGGRSDVWARFNEVLARLAQTSYGWVTRNATPEAPYVAEAVLFVWTQIQNQRRVSVRYTEVK